MQTDSNRLGIGLFATHTRFSSFNFDMLGIQMYENALETLCVAQAIPRIPCWRLDSLVLYKARGSRLMAHGPEKFGVGSPGPGASVNFLFATSHEP